MKKISIVLSSVVLLASLFVATNLVIAKITPVSINTAEGQTNLGQVCIQVITPAIGPEGTCKDFPTPCDVPAGWKKVSSCSNSGVTPINPSNPTPAQPISPITVPVMPIIGDNNVNLLRQELSIREIDGRAICKELGRCPLSEAHNSTEVRMKSAKVIEVNINYLKASIFGYNYKIDITNSNIVRMPEVIIDTSKLSIGDIVNIAGSLDVSDSYLVHATNVEDVSISLKQDVFHGTISSITPPDTFVLNTEEKGTQTVVVTSNTKIIKAGVRGVICKKTPCPLMIYPVPGGTQGSFSDLKIGMQVIVRGTQDKTLSKINAQLIIIRGDIIPPVITPPAATITPPGSTIGQPETGVTPGNPLNQNRKSKIESQQMQPVTNQQPASIPGFWDKLKRILGL